MQKVKWIALLAVICLFVMSIPTFAQLASGNWPRPGRDYHNSGLSPATVIAKPVLKWTTATPARDFTFDGIQIDSQGNIYTGNDYEFYVRKYSSSGSQLWQTSVASHNNFYMYYGLALFDDGTNQYVIGGPQQTGWTGEPSLYAINPSTGAQSWRTGVFDVWCNTGNPGATGKIGSTSNVSPSIGPDGTIYTGNQRDAYYDPTGALYAFNKDGSRKWVYNEYGQGDSYGSAAIKVKDGKNIIYTASGIYNVNATGTGYGSTYGPIPNILAIQDDGTSASKLWSANIGFVTSQPVLSADENTLYVAGRESRPSAANACYVNTNVGLPNFIALDANTGDVKWSLVTGSRHAFSPTLGPDGTIYVCGGYFRTGNQSSGTPDVEPTANPGKLIAIKDNGTSGEIKWTLPLPDDEVSDTTRVAVISTSPTTMYVATGCGRVYCVQDLGDQPKILWTWQAFSTRYCGVMPHGFTPSNIAIADDGTVYTGWGQTLFAFDTGFDTSSPIGISGTVKDANGNPVAGAWVAASTSVRPLADNANHIWTRTNSDGTYQMSPKDLGTYYVAAAAQGYAGSVDQTAVYDNTTNPVVVNITLSPAKYDDAAGSVATATSVNSSYPASNVVDGDLTTRYASTAASSILTVDLGADKTISEAVIYWWFNYAKAYSLEYSTDGTTWTQSSDPDHTGGVAYTTTTGNGGFPLEFYPADPTVAKGTGGTCNYSGGPKTSADVIEFSAITARYWRVNYSSVKNFYGDSLYKNSTAFGSTAAYASIWNIELRDADKAGPTTIFTNIGDVKNAGEGDPINLSNLVVTAVDGGVPANSVFVETADRTAGIRIEVSSQTGIGIGDKISVIGKIYTDANGMKYVNAGTLTRTAAGLPLEALGMNNKAAAEDISQGLFIKTWGKVSASDDTSFTISDGSTTPIKVICGSVDKPAIDSVVRVRGVAGKESSAPVLYMRNESADWTSADASYQALPFGGAYKYAQEYLVLGPYPIDETTYGYYSDWLQIDLINANGGGPELNVSPKAGDQVGDKTWTKAYAADGKLDFNAVFGATTEDSLAYAFINVWSDKDQTIALSTGSDDWFCVLVNGNSTAYISVDQLGIYLNGRGVGYGTDAPVAVPLTAGLNKVLFKVVNHASGFGLCCQFLSSSATGAAGYGGYTPVATGVGYVTSND